jgi:beta-phosphoglucomutase
MNEKAIIFDMDGVICHTNPFHSIAFKAFFAKRNLSPSEPDFAQHMYGKSNKYILSHFLGREIVGQELIDLEFEKESLFREIYATEVVPINGYLHFLKMLKQSGFLTGVATSAPRANLDLIMEKLGFEHQMESIMASENVIKHKPDPEVYLQSANNLCLKPTDCIVFEDSFTGISAGLNAGMKVVGVLSSHTKQDLPLCDFYINDYTEIEVSDINRLLK